MKKTNYAVHVDGVDAELQKMTWPAPKCCPRCGSRRVQQLGKARWNCKGCNKTWSVRKAANDQDQAQGPRLKARTKEHKNMVTDQELEDFEKDMVANPALAPATPTTDHADSVALHRLVRELAERWECRVGQLRASNYMLQSECDEADHEAATLEKCAKELRAEIGKLPNERISDQHQSENSTGANPK